MTKKTTVEPIAEIPDPIDEAIAATEPKPEGPQERRLKADFETVTGGRIIIDVPYPFTPDHFESSVAILMNLRVASDQAEKEDNAKKLVTPDEARGDAAKRILVPVPGGRRPS